MEGRIHNEDATFMIGSVTKLTFYVAFLVATHKDGAEKRERERATLLKDRVSDRPFDVRCANARLEISQQRSSLRQTISLGMSEEVCSSKVSE